VAGRGGDVSQFDYHPEDYDGTERCEDNMTGLPADNIDIAAVHRRLQGEWDKPKRLGDDAWYILGNGRGIIVSWDPDSEPGTDWLHASISYEKPYRFPSYADLKMLHHAVFADGHAYQCFVPSAEHINITANVLHLWGRADGKPALPNFGREGTI